MDLDTISGLNHATLVSMYIIFHNLDLDPIWSRKRVHSRTFGLDPLSNWAIEGPLTSSEVLDFDGVFVILIKLSVVLANMKTTII